MIARFRLIALAEAVSWLLLIGATVAKRAFAVEEATAVIGPVHGVIFLAYLAAVVLLRDELGWSAKRTAIAVAAAVIPLGAYLIVERRYLAEAEAEAEVGVAGRDVAGHEVAEAARPARLGGP